MNYYCFGSIAGVPKEPPWAPPGAPQLWRDPEGVGALQRQYWEGIEAPHPPEWSVSAETDHPGGWGIEGPFQLKRTIPEGVRNGPLRLKRTIPEGGGLKGIGRGLGGD